MGAGDQSEFSARSTSAVNHKVNSPVLQLCILDRLVALSEFQNEAQVSKSEVFGPL